MLEQQMEQPTEQQMERQTEQRLERASPLSSRLATISDAA